MTQYIHSFLYVRMLWNINFLRSHHDFFKAALVEFTVRNQQCKDCQQDFATGSWHAVVQVRQRVTHKRTFYYLEQLLLKHNAHSDCLNIVTFRDGMDFYFTEKQKAVRFIDFLESHVPTKVTHTHHVKATSTPSLLQTISMLIRLFKFLSEGEIFKEADFCRPLSKHWRVQT